MKNSFFVTDLHGSAARYKKLFRAVLNETPEAVFIGGDILPSGFKGKDPDDFLNNTIITGFRSLKLTMGNAYPAVFLILGNDDSKQDENRIEEIESEGLWTYSHMKKTEFKGKKIFGYSYIPPTPFLLKDWEKYDVSRYTDPGCISPEEGKRTYSIEPNIVKYSTIKKDLELLFGEEDVSGSVIIFHSPPYKTNLDRAALDGMFYDSVPLDVHVGSIAIREFIEERQPQVTLHGHIHESAGITGSWRDSIGETQMFSASHDGKELAIVKFDLKDPSSAVRDLL